MRPPRPSSDHASRRRFLRRAAAAAVAGLAPGAAERLLAAGAQAGCDDAPAGTLVRTLPLYGPGSVDTPLGTMLGGGGLDARLFTDLTVLAPDRLTIPAHDFFVRTATPPGLSHDAATWAIQIGGGRGATARPMTAAAVAAKARPMGTHLIECAGNSNPQNFGLMSAATWDGVPIGEVIDLTRPPAGATALLVSGVDDMTQDSYRSTAGCSWVFPLADLAALKPYLATRMNGEALTKDHGAPVRLVVPGWYGCAWIKWVNDIRWVGVDEPATSQMLEFAGRTHQEGRPALARDFAPPAIDTAAMPIRVEQRRVNGAIEYRIVGIVWGGEHPVDQLVLRTSSRDRGTPVRVCPAPASSLTWSLWTHRWRPTEPGYYDLSLRTADASIRTRRLDLSFYIRRVKVDEV